MWQGLVTFWKRLFPGVKPDITLAEQAANAKAALGYEDVTRINFAAIVAGKLANLVTADATVSAVGDSPRARLLHEALQRVAGKLKPIVQRELGVGGVILKPYLFQGQLYVDVLDQSRYVVVERHGEIVTKAGILAEQFRQDGKEYVRMEYHALSEDGLYTIEQKAAVDGQAVPLQSVPQWAALPPVTAIGGVDRMLFATALCPVDPRRPSTGVYGVPITHGQDQTIRRILALLDALQQEFELKQAFVGVSEMLFDSGDRLPADGLYRKFRSDSDDFFETFSPSIREQSYISAIHFALGLLEKGIGVNQGVLTDMDSRNATATEIRRSTADTFALVDAIRKGLEKALTDLAYAFNVYANAAGLGPAGAYALAFDWSYALLEDSGETFRQLMEAKGAGELEEGRVAAYVLDVPLEEAQAQLPHGRQPSSTPVS